jgi:N-acetylneuraminate synthase
METRFILGEKKIGIDQPPFIVAEMSGNHNCSLEQAIRIVEAAAASGAHGLKIQTYTPDTMTLDSTGPGFVISDSNSLWKGKSLYELYREAQTPWEWHEAIFRRCRELGLIAFSTPFDETAVDFLESLSTPCYKIASFENTDLPLIRKAAATGKPLIISTGMATIAELDETVRTAREAGCRSLMLLKCTSSYPADPTDTNVRTLPHLRTLFHCEVGLSDHTGGIGAAVASVALGATLIEKHFTLLKADGGPDAAFSIEPDEMKLLVTETERAWQSLGHVSYGVSKAEEKSLIFRRSLYVVEDVEQGEALSVSNLRAIRPGLGLPPKFYDILLGRRAKQPIKKGTPTSWDLFE